MTELQVGRELDALVAEKVMGVLEIIPYGTSEGDFFCVLGYTQDGGGISEPLKHYSTSISAAWEVVEKVNQQMDLGFLPDKDGRLQYDCSFGPDNTERNPTCNYADTAPLAICLAALKVGGVTV